METLVSDIMKNQVISIDSSMSVNDAAKMMSDLGVGCLVVIQENIPVGILTERDFVTKVAFLAESSSRPVRNVMSWPLIAINPKETIRNLAEPDEREKNSQGSCHRWKQACRNCYCN